MKQTEVRFAVLGGDERQFWLAKGLREQGNAVDTLGVPGMDTPYSEEALEWADVVILPLPSFDGADNVPGMGEWLSPKQLSEKLSPGAVLYGGKLTASQREVLGRNHRVVDYENLEGLAAANAVPTVEGTVELALREMPITLWDSRCLVIGFGRVGKVLSLRLQALGAHVTVTARNPEDLALIQALGLEAAVIGAEELPWNSYDLVVNTVPAVVVGQRELEQLRQEALVIDVASRPGGVDRAAADALGKRVLWALGLPGKTAPATAGRLILKAILKDLEKKEAEQP